MALTINWSEEAKVEFDQIIAFLSYRWTEKEVQNFILKTESVLKAISLQPYLYPESHYKQIRKAVITKQTSVYYLIREHEIYLVTFWDNRQDSADNPF